ncbi:MAG TPA: MarR family transcriptional regulator [Ramlibacter sp.]|uniref:MarR family winged helix-turn-helix transcriptional regulator n=1 Tax=Ramlibacter sp. TaxID=1917967 RepID=UPI002D80D36C|nr:MarR family transcriptional regulator [Ramlibacter sp.]HET8748184.1 MarR family transcriptional regulator [Ramlibacter sp.]
MGSRPATAVRSVLGRSLTYRLHLLHKITDLVSQQSYVDAVGLSLSDGRCLATIGSFGPLSVNELAEHSNLNKSQGSRAAQFLVEQGLVEKVCHPEDGRGVLLSLTPEGRKVWLRTIRMVEERNAQIFGCLSAQEQAVLSDMFDRLIEHNRRG